MIHFTLMMQTYPSIRNKQRKIDIANL